MTDKFKWTEESIATERETTEYNVRAALRRRKRSEEEMFEAYEAYLSVPGNTYSSLARLLGVTRQAARQMIERGRRS